ncbi:phosphoribosylglycinamide synthetase C domain-containing protein [Oleiharenicola sp. Vm1]|uniref:phosphoribosylglycinamide synthetase C domain-containing protein n=1 Tax=Oleiharenicola sp. Vm1 TaxID=3398393 RepID=UPI0039F5A2DE
MSAREGKRPTVLVLGIGPFAHSTAAILGECGAIVATYLTRDYAHYGPGLVGATYTKAEYPSPVPLVAKLGVDLVIPQSIDWMLQEWTQDLLASGVAIFSPVDEGMRIERERDFARELCERFGIAFPRSFVARDRSEAEALLAAHRVPFVIKNPLCRPSSPIHTIVCGSIEETAAWLPHLNYSEGVFLQEYAGAREVGHIALVSEGEVRSMVTNQEYKRAHDNNTGLVAGAPLGGLVERDEADRYGLARELLSPLAPWFREVNFHGPIQVTAALKDGRWSVLEYNVRIGVTSGAMMLRMLENPFEVLHATARNARLAPLWKSGPNCGCSVTLASYGYPFTQVTPPAMPIAFRGGKTVGAGDCWWGEVERRGDSLMAVGHRVADVIGFGSDMAEAIEAAYSRAREIIVPGGYCRTDIGKSLWPPGSE